MKLGEISRRCRPGAPFSFKTENRTVRAFFAHGGIREGRVWAGYLDLFIADLDAGDHQAEIGPTKAGVVRMLEALPDLLSNDLSALFGELADRQIPLPLQP